MFFIFSLFLKSITGMVYHLYLLDMFKGMDTKKSTHIFAIFFWIKSSVMHW